MAHLSKSDRRRLQQAGHGISGTVYRRLPTLPPPLPARTPAVEFRLRCVQHARASSVREASVIFGRSKATVYRWLTAYATSGERGLHPRSRRPHHTRKQQWSAAAEARVLELRTTHHRAGKAKLRRLLAAEGITVSESMIGRMLISLRKRRLLREPVLRTRSVRRQLRPYATRVPLDKRHPTEPGALIQVDTVHICPSAGPQRRQFTAIDVVSRYAVLGVRSTASARTATTFLDEIITRMPMPVHAIQVDGGSEFMAEFEEACRSRGIAMYVLPPRSPKLNGRVERMNGTCRREFWEWYGGELTLEALTPALRAFETFYNHERLHQGLGYRTPASTLGFSYVSN